MMMLTGIFCVDFSQCLWKEKSAFCFQKTCNRIVSFCCCSLQVEEMDNDFSHVRARPSALSISNSPVASSQVTPSRVREKAVTVSSSPTASVVSVMSLPDEDGKNISSIAAKYAWVSGEDNRLPAYPSDISILDRYARITILKNDLFHAHLVIQSPHGPILIPRNKIVRISLRNGKQRIVYLTNFPGLVLGLGDIMLADIPQKKFGSIIFVWVELAAGNLYGGDINEPDCSQVLSHRE